MSLNADLVHEKIASAAARAGRDASEITVVAVSKLQSAEDVKAAVTAGFRIFGENYVNEAALKKSSVGNEAETEWHLIGHLQTNKARAAIETFDLIQSVDGEKLARTLSRIASECGIHQRVLIQVHLGDELTKSGVAPAQALDLAGQTAEMPGLIVEGLMGIAPQGTDPRPYFRDLRKLYEQLPATQREFLSMGMSSDYPVAIEEGSTMVRIGTALFGPRP